MKWPSLQKSVSSFMRLTPGANAKELFSTFKLYRFMMEYHFTQCTQTV
jgi:hypothetical protein